MSFTYLSRHITDQSLLWPQFIFYVNPRRTILHFPLPYPFPWTVFLARNTLPLSSMHKHRRQLSPPRKSYNESQKKRWLCLLLPHPLNFEEISIIDVMESAVIINQFVQRHYEFLEGRGHDSLHFLFALLCPPQSKHSGFEWMNKWKHCQKYLENIEQWTETSLQYTIEEGSLRSKNVTKINETQSCNIM